MAKKGKKAKKHIRKKKLKRLHTEIVRVSRRMGHLRDYDDSLEEDDEEENI